MKTLNLEEFVVKNYVGHDRPVIKGNSFDGLEIGETKEEGQEFVDFVNMLIQYKRRNK